MGRSSGGAFDRGVTSVYSSSGRAEAFGDNATNPRRHTDDDTYLHQPSSYYDSYWTRSYTNRLRSWRSASGHQEPRHREAVQFGYGFFVVFAFFSLFLSMWLLLGLYGSQDLEMGMFYSRVMKSNSLFVKEIKIQNLRERGPECHSFLSHPHAGHSLNFNDSFNDVVVDSLYHQRYGFWLNKGSSFDLSYELEDTGSSQDKLIVAIVRGEDGFQEWKGDPDNPNLTLLWKRVQDVGSVSFKVEEDDDYFVVFGNLNSHKMKFSFKMKMRYVVYSKENADLVCSTVNTKLCKFPLRLGRSTFVLLSSPVVKQRGVDYWKAKVSYVPRWITYIFLWSLVGAGLLITRAVELRSENSDLSATQEQALLVLGGDDVPGSGAPERPSATPVRVDDSLTERGNIPEDQLCSICLDAPKDCFLDPCGHRCTCYSCGVRIQRGDSARCPICRQSIRTVRRIYNS